MSLRYYNDYSLQAQVLDGKMQLLTSLWLNGTDIGYIGLCKI